MKFLFLCIYIMFAYGYGAESARSYKNFMQEECNKEISASEETKYLLLSGVLMPLTEGSKLAGNLESGFKCDA